MCMTGRIINPMHDEVLAIEQLKALPKDAKMHLAHILRNGLCAILGATYTDDKHEVRRRIQALEIEITKKLGI